jgi:hypothetical protein
VLDICPTVKPQPVQVGERHWVSCFWATGQGDGAGGRAEAS